MQTVTHKNASLPLCLPSYSGKLGLQQALTSNSVSRNSSGYKQVYHAAIEFKYQCRTTPILIYRKNVLEAWECVLRYHSILEGKISQA